MNSILMIGASTLLPYQYVDQSGKMSGLDFELVRDAFASAGYQIKVVMDDWTKIEAAVNNGKLHAAFQVERTRERGNRFFLSAPLHQYHSEVVTANPYLSRLASFDDVVARRLAVGVLLNDAYAAVLNRLGTFCQQRYAQPADLLNAVRREEVDLGIIDQRVRAYLKEKGGDDSLWTVDELRIERPMYVLFSNRVLRDAFNGGLRAVQNRNISRTLCLDAGLS